MRTSVTISDELVEDLMRFSEARTKTEAVNRAVSEWVRRRKVEELRSLRGGVQFDRGIEEIRRVDMEEAGDLEVHPDVHGTR